MTDAARTSTSYETRAVKDNLKLVGWVFAWMASLTFSDKAALYGWWTQEWITATSIAVNAGLGLWVILGFVKLLRGMDDLQRKIQLESLAIALGVSMVAAVSYSLLVTWGYILDEEVSDLFVVMCLTYSAAVMINVVRYR